MAFKRVRLVFGCLSDSVTEKSYSLSIVTFALRRCAPGDFSTVVFGFTAFLENAVKPLWPKCPYFGAVNLDQYPVSKYQT